VLRLVLPKGSLEHATLQLFEDADLALTRASDVDYKATIDDPRVVDVTILRPQEIPRYVADGLFDIGVTGRDWIEETSVEVVTLTDTGTDRATYADVCERIDRLCRALASLGVGEGDRVATFAWNSQRHLEAYMGVPCMGAVLHTLNIRLFEEQLTYIANHAEDKVVLVDDSLVPVLEKVAPTFETVSRPNSRSMAERSSRSSSKSSLADDVATVLIANGSS